MKATFGAGCFWGVESNFFKIGGVKKTEAGYSGGNFENPTYEDVCTGKTAHAEVVQIEYDPKKITYEKLLQAFFGMHDPTQKNRQGPDVGSQYRSIILYHISQQKKTAEKYIKSIQKNYSAAIATQVVKFEKFYSAAEYHQKYLEKSEREVCAI